MSDEDTKNLGDAPESTDPPEPDPPEAATPPASFRKPPVRPRKYLVPERPNPLGISDGVLRKIPLPGDTGLEGPKTRIAGTTAARINHIVELMSTFQYKRGKTGAELARKWGLSPATITSLVGQASKIVRASVMDVDDIQANVGLALRTVLDSCLDDNERDPATKKPKFKNESTAIANRKVAIEACIALARISGADAPKRTEISGPDGAPLQATAAAAVAGMTPAQVDELLHQAAERRRARLAQHQATVKQTDWSIGVSAVDAEVEPPDGGGDDQ
jgi:hypothetical protein